MRRTPPLRKSHTESLSISMGVLKPFGVILVICFLWNITVIGEDERGDHRIDHIDTVAHKGMELYQELHAAKTKEDFAQLSKKLEDLEWPEKACLVKLCEGRMGDKKAWEMGEHVIVAGYDLSISGHRNTWIIEDVLGVQLIVDEGDGDAMFRNIMRVDSIVKERNTVWARGQIENARRAVETMDIKERISCARSEHTRTAILLVLTEDESREVRFSLAKNNRVPYGLIDVGEDDEIRGAETSKLILARTGEWSCSIFLKGALIRAFLDE